MTLRPAVSSEGTKCREEFSSCRKEKSQTFRHQILEEKTKDQRNAEREGKESVEELLWPGEQETSSFQNLKATTESLVQGKG